MRANLFNSVYDASYFNVVDKNFHCVHIDSFNFLYSLPVGKNMKFLNSV